jgi:NitT/TauT family transport system ATP-binding protein
MSLIRAENLSYIYRDNDSVFRALNRLDFEIEEGEFICIVGHSGCGKSTLLSMLAGLLPASEGALYLRGTPIKEPGSDRAIVFQEYSLFPWMTARKNVIFGIRHAAIKRSRKDAAVLADVALEQVGMLDFADRYPFQLSGGMQQRVALVRALSMDPQILLLDEPFGALDAKRRIDLQILLDKLWRESPTRKTIVFVTHDIDEAILLADRVFFMRPGTIEAVFDIPFERPRAKDEIGATDEYQRIKQELMRLFYLDKEADDDKENL